MHVCIPSLCCPKQQQKQRNQQKGRKEHYEDFGENNILRATLNQKEGRHVGSHDGFQSYALHNRRKRGGCWCFEEAQDSYGLEANHRRHPQKDHSSLFTERVSGRDGEVLKCKRPTRAGRRRRSDWIFSSEKCLKKKKNGGKSGVNFNKIHPNSWELSNRKLL